MSRKKKRITIKIEKKRSTKTRNWLAVAAHFRNNAGTHKNKKKYPSRNNAKINLKKERW